MREIKMKNQELFELNNTLKSIKGVTGVKFNYAIARNKRIVKEELECLQEGIKPSESYTELEKKRVELCEQYATKDEKGKPIIEDNKYDIVEIDKFNEELKSLRDDYKETLIERTAQVNNYSKLLNENVREDLELYLIAIEDLPDSLTTEMIENLYSLIRKENINGDIK